MSSQIEFIRLTTGNTFPGNSLPAAISANLTGLTPALLHRRVYANITQPADFTRVVAFTLDFKLQGVSQGTIGQRLIYEGGTKPTGVQHYWSLGVGGGGGSAVEDLRKLPGSMLSQVQNATAMGVNREIAPIDVTLQIDEIALTCTEWNTYLYDAAAANYLHIVLACMSSLHRF